MIISASILAANLLKLGSQVQEVEQLGVKRIHLDVMDNHAVPNLSFGLDFCSALKSSQSLPVAVHLMTQPVKTCVTRSIEAKADWIIFHPDACDDWQSLVDEVKQGGIKVGLAIHPETPIRWLDRVNCSIDQLLIMTVIPGFAGQRFLENGLEKIHSARAWIDANQVACELAVDGGVNAENIHALEQAGVDVAVMGSGLFSGNIQKNWYEISKSCQLHYDT